jgi:hypothetical protein
VNHDVIVFIALIPAVTVTVATAAAGARLVLILRLRGSVGTKQAGEDGTRPEQGTAQWGAASIHPSSRVGSSPQEKFQYVGCLCLHCQVQGAPAACRLRLVEVSSSVPQQSDHLCVFVDDGLMQWGVAFIVFSL